MHLLANFFFSVNDFCNCMRIFGDQRHHKMTATGCKHKWAPHSVLFLAYYFLLRQLVFVVPIILLILRMKFFEFLILLEIQFPRWFKEFIFFAGPFLISSCPARAESWRSAYAFVQCESDQSRFQRWESEFSHNVLIVKIQVQRNCSDICKTADENFPLKVIKQTEEIIFKNNVLIFNIKSKFNIIIKIEDNSSFL